MPPYPPIPMNTPFTIFKKGLTLIAVPLLVQAVFIAVLVRAQAEQVRAQEWVVHTKDVIAKLEELHRGLIEGYAGTRGVHLLAFHDFNAPIPTIDNGVMTFVHPVTNPTTGQVTLVQNARPDPNFGALDMLDTSSYSSYNALQVGLQHRLSSNVVFQASYTYSHCIDSAYTYGGLGFNNVSSAVTNPYDWNNDKGNCSFDLRHNISANAVYVFPFKGNRWKEGWQLTAVQSWHTGVPFSLGEGDQADLGNNFDTERPNYVAGCDVYANQSVHQWYNPACFTASAYGTIGNLGRNVLVGPGYVDTDLGILKTTRINERFNLQFRA